MGFTEQVLNDVRQQIDAHATPLAEARTRLDLVRSVAKNYPGALRTYPSGSLAQNTFIHPVGDGDGGLVLDRRCFPRLGPDGGGEAPAEITQTLCALLGPAVREVYPNAACYKSKRGPKLVFRKPVEDQDPTVDLVVALTRRSGLGLWIPNLHTNKWEASDPEQHVEMFTSGAESLRRTRRRVVRLLKAWNKQYSQPGFSSHNLTVWAWEFVEPGMGVAVALRTVLDRAAKRVQNRGATVDPAGVSPNVKLLIDRQPAGRRLRTAADALIEALAHDDDQTAVRSALARAYFSYVDDPTPTSVAGKVAALRRNVPMVTASLGLAGPSALIRPTRAYGDAGAEE